MGFFDFEALGFCGLGCFGLLGLGGVLLPLDPSVGGYSSSGSLIGLGVPPPGNRWTLRPNLFRFRLLVATSNVRIASSCAWVVS